MDRRALLAVVLSIFVLGLWQIFFAPTPPPKQEPATTTGSAGGPAPAGEAGEKVVEEEKAEPEERLLLEPGAADAFGEVIQAAEPREFIVDTGIYSVRFANRGGRLISWRLKDYVDDLDVPVDIVPRELDQLADFPLRLILEGDDPADAALDEVLYREEVLESTIGWPGDGFQGKVVRFEYADGRGLRVLKSLALPEEGYVCHLRVEVERDGAPAPFDMTWAVGLHQPNNDKTTTYFAAEGQGIIHSAGDVERFAADNVDAIAIFPAGPGAPAVAWYGLESTYFASLLLPEPEFKGRLAFVPAGVVRSVESGDEEPVLSAHFETREASEFSAVVGPKDYDLLLKTGRELERTIDFSRYSLIYAITKYLFLALRWVNGFLGNYGLSIIVLTALIRVAFFPLTYRSMITMRRTSKKMQKIQPRVKQIQERYKKQKRTMDSQKKMNDEIMGIYRKEGVNPMGSIGGCLPLLLQMPVFIGFYNLLSVTIEMRGAGFALWIQDLSKMDPYYVLPILMGGSWMVQQWMTSSSIPDPMQRRLMGAMPLIFTFMMARMPSGLVLYWFMSNLLGMVQQWIINRQADAGAEPA